MTPEYTILSTPTCSYCAKAKEHLERIGLSYREFNIKENPQLLDFLDSNGLRTVPQIYRRGFHVGGYSDLLKYLEPTS